ncbi:MAG: response regulator transcription factor [Defluviitaleaceae bacterium]|nr:response regulator transcription factor [Defluviitaleaceae bacterium]
MIEKNTFKILFVEDDIMIASGLVYALENEGFFVSHAKDIASAQKAAKGQKYDLGLLDIGLPDGTGFELVSLLQGMGASVLFLTAVDDEGNLIKAFEGGADDYVTKPFRLGELMARIKSVLRRRTGQGTALTWGSVTINVNEGKAYVTGKALELTALEYRLLLTFANHKGQVLSRGQLLSLLWDSEGIFVEDNTLTVYIKRLREKLGKSANIETVRGMGYRANVH